jgi:phosphotriesterase-related protein
MEDDILVGVGDTGIRAGIIGEIGCSLPLDDTERKVLDAAAAAQRRTGAALSIHPSPADELAMDIVQILADADADLQRTVICHVDSMGFADSTIRAFLDAGCSVEYDTFGSEGVAVHSPTHGRVLDKPSDVQRVNAIIQLIGDGYLDQILLSSDICSKHRLTLYGGYGYGHILMNIVPLLKYKGVSDEQIQRLLIDNPKRILTFNIVH